MPNPRQSETMKAYHRKSGHVVWDDFTADDVRGWLTKYQGGISLEGLSKEMNLGISGVAKVLKKFYPEEYQAEVKRRRPGRPWLLNESTFRRKVALILEEHGFIVAIRSKPDLHLLAIRPRDVSKGWGRKLIAIYCDHEGNAPIWKLKLFEQICQSLGAQPGVAAVDGENSGIAVSTLPVYLGKLEQAS